MIRAGWISPHVQPDCEAELRSRGSLCGRPWLCPGAARPLLCACCRAHIEPRCLLLLKRGSPWPRAGTDRARAVLSASSQLCTHHAKRNSARRPAGLTAVRQPRQLGLPWRRAARHLQVLDPGPRYTCPGSPLPSAAARVAAGATPCASTPQRCVFPLT